MLVITQKTRTAIVHFAYVSIADTRRSFDMDTVVDLMLKYFDAIDSGDDTAIEAAYQAWMAGRGEKPAKRLVAIGDAGGVTAVAPEWEQRRSGFGDWVWDETDPEGLGDGGEPFVSCEWQAGDDWHAERQKLADYDASMDAASNRH